MAEALATRYRPRTFDDVTEQESVKIILQQQLKSGEVQHAYLFTGGAGTGKTTCARIFANAINKGKGNPLELDAASNNSVDDIRGIIQQSRVKSLDSEYRIFILDEVHALSNNAWQALLKLLEEPPAKAIFIMCTTNPEKIPRTILSRVQRFDFKRISQKGIVDRLNWILQSEFQDFFNTNMQGRENEPITDEDLCLFAWEKDALEYIAKIADGGMRDAITLLDKCLAYSRDVTLESVVKALGIVDYDVFFHLTDAIRERNSEEIIKTIEGIYSDGKDLKQFVKDYLSFLLDVNKYDILHTMTYLQLPGTYESQLQSHSGDNFFNCCKYMLPLVVQLNAEIKWDTQPKVTIEAKLLGVCYE